VTEIAIDIDDRTTFGRITNDAGGTDLELRAPTPRQAKHRSGTAVSSLNSYTEFGGGWHTAFSQTNALSSGTQMFPRDIDLTLGEGRLSDDLRSLSPVRNLRLDVMTTGQLALHMPTVISIG
jgi:hypothetical protein